MSGVRRISDGIRNMIDELEKELPSETIRLSLDAAELVSSRIIETGKDADGRDLKFKSGTPYSEKEVPAFFYKGKSRTGSAESFIDNLIEQGETLSYKEFREINNLPTDRVTLSFTSRMWNNLGVISVTDKTGRVQVGVAAKQRAEQNKINWNSARYGSILRVSESEREELNLNLLDFARGVALRNLP